MEEEGDPFYKPCHVTKGLVVGAALCVLVHGPAVQLRIGAVAQRLPWNFWRRHRPFFPPLLVSRITWEAGLGCCPPSSPSQLCDMEGVAGGQVGRDLRLEAVDVAAVAEQVAFQWITAVALFVV